MKTYAHILPSLEARLSEGLEATFQAAAVGGASFLLPPPTDLESRR
jgi:hypothetical protein